MIRIIATADVHSPRFIELFMKSLDQVVVQPDLVVLAGDMVEKNNIYALQPVYNAIIDRFRGIPIVSVFGNEEFRGFEDKYRTLYSEFKWLNDEYVVLDIKGFRVAIIGTRGSLDKPTTWQIRNIPGISNYYGELPYIISRYVDEARLQRIDYLVLISHYGVTYENLDGEDKSIWPYLACRKFEEIIVSKQIDLVIHAHAHKGIKECIYIGGTPVYNVSLPARCRLVEIILEKKKAYGLEKWFVKVE
ncbi:MAG: metallophosphoesterase [Desulfurococcaceae archaeon]